jgi:acyl-coenzyme A thioesterase 9
LAHSKTRSTPINPLIVETPEEKRLFAEGERNSKQRKELGKHSLKKHTPNDEESDIIHALWQKQLEWHGKWNQSQIDHQLTIDVFVT